MPNLVYISPMNTSISLGDHKDFILSDVEGLTRAGVAISANDNANEDGTTVNNSRTQPRGIVLYLTTKPNADVEAVKREVLGVIKLKQKGRLQWIQKDKTIEIEGIVEAIEMPRFTDSVVIQITMYCAQPYWQDLYYIVKYIELVDDMHKFTLVFPQGVGISFGKYNTDLTKTFVNYGDSSVGCIITIIATSYIENPLLERVDGKFFGVNEQMQQGDSIIINTIKGKKSVTKNGVNIMHKIKERSTWLQLETGENTFTISDSGKTGNLYFTFEYKQRYV